MRCVEFRLYAVHTAEFSSLHGGSLEITLTVPLRHPAYHSRFTVYTGPGYFDLQPLNLPVNTPLKFHLRDCTVCHCIRDPCQVKTF